MDDSRRAIAERYRRRADAFEATVSAVREEGWDSPSPCAEWDARDVVRHVVDMHSAMLRPFGRQPTPGVAAARPLTAVRRPVSTCSRRHAPTRPFERA